MKNNSTKTPAIQFPPYGIMDNDFLKDLGSENLLASPAEPMVPPDFNTKASINRAERETCWTTFREETLDGLAEVLWPVWDPKALCWNGGAAKKMVDLTYADLDILSTLRTDSGRLLLNTIPTSDLRAIDCPPHADFFREEDQANIFKSYGFYDRTLDTKYPAIFSAVFFAGLDAKCSSTQLQFKRRLQRPRPYQVALLVGRGEFNWEEATSSMTPSMISGHSLQGLIGVGAVMEQVIESAISFSAKSWRAISQYAVDIGDRRVMAGVHYPSDNLASWIVLMRMANRIFRSKDVKDKLWRAIKDQSVIYDLIVQSGAKAYSAGLDLLSQAKDSE